MTNLSALSAIDCIIFDMDGTLVDSEVLSCQALLDVFPEMNIPLSEVVETFGGQKLPHTFNMIAERFGSALPDDIEQTFRKHVADLFDTHLNAFPGVHDLLEKLSVPFCIATSAPHKKAAHVLGKTELTGFFGDRIYSSYDIGSWKPEPDIFLHAAANMNALPKNCLVVEDSKFGIQAAKSADMRVVQFCGETRAPLHDAYFRSYSDLSMVLPDEAKRRE